LGLYILATASGKLKFHVMGTAQLKMAAVVDPDPQTRFIDAE